MPGFIDNNYFGDVRNLMIERGFVLFGFVGTSTDDGFVYNIGAPNARTTSLFFHYPNKSLIVMLDYHEDDYFSAFHEDSEYYKENMGGHWTIRFYYEFVDVKTFCDMTLLPAEEREYGSCGGEDHIFKEIILHDFSPVPQHFTWHGNDEMCELYQTEKPTTPTVVVDEIWSIAEQVLPFLDKLPFGELQVTSFPPIHTFDDCEEQFWEKFKESVSRRYLWSLAKRPWGSDGLRR